MGEVQQTQREPAVAAMFEIGCVKERKTPTHHENLPGGRKPSGRGGCVLALPKRGI